MAKKSSEAEAKRDVSLTVARALFQLEKTTGQTDVEFETVKHDMMQRAIKFQKLLGNLGLKLEG